MVAETGTPAEARRFEKRYTPLIAALGTIPVPELLVAYYGRLGLTTAELTYRLQVLRFYRVRDNWPWLTAKTVADAGAVYERKVREWRASLREKGYLLLRQRGEPHGRGAERHDLSPLPAALEFVAREEWDKRAPAFAEYREPPEPEFPPWDPSRSGFL